jgi:hypothetical protein
MKQRGGAHHATDQRPVERAHHGGDKAAGRAGGARRPRVRGGLTTCSEEARSGEDRWCMEAGHGWRGD